MELLHRISVTCFTACYLLVVLLEIARIYTDSDWLSGKVMRFVQFLTVAAGLFAHSAFLAHHGGWDRGDQTLWINNWFGWCLAVSWMLVLAYLWISVRQPRSGLGLFLLPIAMGLIWYAHRFGSLATFPLNHDRSGWNFVHGASLLLGTSIVTLGFIFGVTYLIQSYRLKHKSVSWGRIKFPSLEWLQNSAERCLLVSAVLLGIGLGSGVVMVQLPVTTPDNGTQFNAPGVWHDPVVWTSAILFVWLVAASIFNLIYRPARQGRKVAYLVVTSFLFLLMELMIVWWMGHATIVAGLPVVDSLSSFFIEWVLKLGSHGEQP